MLKPSFYSPYGRMGQLSVSTLSPWWRGGQPTVSASTGKLPMPSRAKLRLASTTPIPSASIMVMDHGWIVRSGRIDCRVDSRLRATRTPDPKTSIVMSRVPMHE